MPVIFADPFGSFLGGFERGLNARIAKEESEQQRRINEYELYDRFVFSPMQEIAKEQRAFDRQLRLMEIRRANAAADRASAAAAREVDRRNAARGGAGLRISAAASTSQPSAGARLNRGFAGPDVHFPTGNSLRLNMGVSDL